MSHTSSPHPESTHIDPVDDETPKESPPTTEAQEFAKVLDLLIKTSTKSSKYKPKLREPDVFECSNSKKLHTFILQCKLNFCNRKDLFKDETANVNSALSYLKGISLDC